MYFLIVQESSKDTDTAIETFKTLENAKAYANDEYDADSGLEFTILKQVNGVFTQIAKASQLVAHLVWK